MILVPNWRRVLLRASSLWPVYLASALELAVEFIPYVGDWVPRWALLVLLIATPLFRIIRQEKLRADQ